MNRGDWLQIGVGALSGNLFAVLGGALASLLARGETGFDGIAAVVGGLLMGFPLGVTFGVTYTGWRLGRGLLPWGALVGSIIAIVLVMFAGFWTGLRETPLAMFAVMCVVGPSLAWVGYRVSNRASSPTPADEQSRR